MSDIERRARELLASEYEADGCMQLARMIRSGAVTDTDFGSVKIMRAMRAIIAALMPPEGYVMVPVEPTAEMLQAAAFGVAGKSGQKFKPMMSAGYSAMLAARPEVLGG